MRAKLLKIVEHNRTLFLRIAGKTNYYDWKEEIDWMVDGVSDGDIVDVDLDGNNVTRIKFTRKTLTPDQAKQRAIIYQSSMKCAVESLCEMATEEAIISKTRTLAEFIIDECDL